VGRERRFGRWQRAGVGQEKGAVGLAGGEVVGAECGVDAVVRGRGIGAEALDPDALPAAA